MDFESDSPEILIPEDWSAAAESIAAASPAPIAFICGPKNSGKTTFSRHLLNVLLQRYSKVAYLDTDVGQAVFTPPGFLSLVVVDKQNPDLAIPCLKTPERSYFFGDISSKRDPKAYISYVSSLCNHYRKEYCKSDDTGNPNRTKVPLLVNTPGWVKGVGYDILVDMLKCIAPTHVVKINAYAKNKNLPSGVFWSERGNKEVAKLIEIDSAPQDSSNNLVKKDANLLRDLGIMAYFRQCFQSNTSITTIRELAQALTSQPPYEVPLSTITIRNLYSQVPISEIFYALNASIVGLAISAREGPESLPLCVGLGIVRGIDTSKGLLYVITPVPPSALEKVDLFLQGLIQIPTGLLQVQGCVSPYMSSNVLCTS